MNEIKKILYVTTISKTVNAFLIPHIKYLIEKGNEVDVATNIGDVLSDELICLGVKQYNIQFQRNPLSTKNLSAFREISELQKQLKYDIVHVHTPVASFITRFALKNNKDVKIIYTAHGFHFYKGAPLLNWLLYFPLEKVAAKWTDALITINQEDFKRASNLKLRKNGTSYKIPGVGIEENIYGINKNENIRNELNLKPDDFVILVISELNSNKNHIQLIKAMKLLENKHPNIKAIFAGTGPLESSLTKKIFHYGLNNRIQLLGWRNDIPELINSSDVVGLFSKREGLGKCLIEAMICGTPIIATKTRGAKEIITHETNGFLIDLGNVEKTAYYIERFYKDKELSTKFSKRNYQEVERFLLENVLKKLDVIYEKKT